MSEVLSQSEIDNLLNALKNGELDVDEMKDKDEKQVKNYDFARPTKFSKEHLRTLEIILNIMVDCCQLIFLHICERQYRLRLSIPNR